MNKNEADELQTANTESKEELEDSDSMYVKEKAKSTRSPSRDQNEDSEGSEKQSPTNQSFLTNLKGFNIEKATYRHYGNKSSMDAKTLEKIMNESKSASTQPDIPEETEDSNGSEPPKTKKSIKYIIDEQIGQILGVSEQIISEDDIKPYDVSTLNEILKFKCEQERTKQDSIKCEFAVNVLELLKLAQSLNIEVNLIPFLFFGDIPVTTLTRKLQNLKNDASSVINDLRDASKTNTLIPQITDILCKLKNKETPVTSTGTEPGSRNTNFNSPITSPTLPNDSHRRVQSEGSIDKESVTSEPSRMTLPIPNYSPQLQQPQVTQNVYSTPYYNQASPNVPQNPPKDRQGSLMGSPYSQKYTNVMYPQSQAAYQGTSNFVPQQQFQFYVPSMSNNGPYMLQGHPPVHHPFAYNQYQNPEPESKNSSSHYFRANEDTSPAKKARYSKPSEINFMISTPKNPPARKYNTHSTSRDK